MMLTTLVLMTLVSRTPLLNLYNEAVEMVSDGSYGDAASLFSEILERMPDNPRALYNHSVSFLPAGDYSTADSLLTTVPDGVFSSDTLLAARSSARLGSAMESGDYSGVRSVVDMLLPEVRTGQASSQVLQNYEVALKWLSQNEPPPPEQNQNNQNDQNDDQNDQSQNQDNQDNDQNSDQNQNNDENQNNSDTQDGEDDNQGGSEQDDQSDAPQRQPQPPAQPEMTPDVAKMILDMVEEAEADTTEETSAGISGAPIW